MDRASADVTGLLAAWKDGDAAALAVLTERVYAELHQIAHRLMRGERHARTWQTTALVNEAFARLLDADALGGSDRSRFFALAACVMRRILVDEARARGAGKRGGGLKHVDLDVACDVAIASDAGVLALDDALEALVALAPRQAKVVELRWFGGLSEAEIAGFLEVSERTVRRDWDLARAWLWRELSAG